MLRLLLNCDQTGRVHLFLELTAHLGPITELIDRAWPLVDPDKWTGRRYRPCARATYRITSLPARPAPFSGPNIVCSEVPL